MGAQALSLSRSFTTCPYQCLAMESLSFVFADRVTVPGYLGLDVQHELTQHIDQLGADKILLVTDEAVDQMHADYFAPLEAAMTGETGETGASNIQAVEKF